MRMFHRESLPTNGEFNVVNELGDETAATISIGLIETIDNHTRLPYLRGGYLAAEHMVVFGSTGFSQWSDQLAVRAALEERFFELKSRGQSEAEEIPEWVMGLYTPALYAAAILYGRRPTEREQETVRMPLLKATDRRIDEARKTYNESRKTFQWTYAAEQLAELRVLLGEEDFQAALSMGGGLVMSTVDELKHLFASNIRKYNKDLVKKGGSPTGITGNLATLRIIEAQSVEIVEGEGLRIVEGNAQVSPHMPNEEKQQLGRVAVTES